MILIKDLETKQEQRVAHCVENLIHLNFKTSNLLLSTKQNKI